MVPPDSGKKTGKKESLYQDAPYPYQSLDVQGNILEINPAWLELFGYQEQDVLGRSWMGFLGPESRVQVLDRFRVFKQTGRIAGMYFDVVRKDGTLIPVRVDGRITCAPGGDFERTHCFLLDMRPELEARRALAQNERKYRQLVEMALGGIWQIDRDGKTTFVNNAMAEMLEYASAELLGRHFFEFMDGRGVELAKRYMARRKQGLADQHDFEFVTKSGKRVMTFINTRPLLDDEGTYAGALAEVIDVTHRRRCEKEAFHAQKLESLGVMAGGIAHDFNNLLQAVVGNLDLIDQEIPAVLPIRHHLEDIRAATARARDLCRQMLVYAGRTDFMLEDIDLGALVRQMRGLMSISLDKKAELRLEIEDGLPLVYGDATQLRQAVMNLITNGSEALGGRSGQVAVRIGTQVFQDEAIGERFPGRNLPGGRYVVLRVEDTGCGMDAEVQQRLFDPFFSTKFTGRGMGMASVRGIIDAHNGAIRVRSRPWEGTTIEVVLPAAIAEQRRPVRPVAGTEGKGLLVLVADDEEMVLRMLEQMLIKLGFRVRAVKNGNEAVQAFAQAAEKAALVLLDMTMPELDGAEAFLQIRSLDAKVPVFILSGFPPEDIALRFPDPKPDGFLQKPFSLDDLRILLGAVSGRGIPTPGNQAPAAG